MQWLPGSLDTHASLPRPRPIGHLCVLGVRGDNLWLVDSLGQLVLLSLGNPGVPTHAVLQSWLLVFYRLGSWLIHTNHF